LIATGAYDGSVGVLKSEHVVEGKAAGVVHQAV